MNKRRIISAITMFLVMATSCDEPETVVTNIVHPDGSVTRMIEMKNNENKFKLSNLQVPFDSTWFVKDSIEVNDQGDTTWVKRATKLFKNVDEINATYQADSGANKHVSRYAGFIRKFRWFNTEFRFSENINKTMSFGYPVKDFLNSGELLWFYSPDSVKHKKINGIDSLEYKALDDNVDKKTEIWAIKNMVSEWIGEFSKLIEGKASGELSGESLKEVKMTL